MRPIGANERSSSKVAGLRKTYQKPHRNTVLEKSSERPPDVGPPEKCSWDTPLTIHHPRVVGVF